MTKANFFIVGAPKCGTTAWVQYLSPHPDVFFSQVKEPHYFAFDLEGMRQIRSIGEYNDLFRGRVKQKAVAEASVLYLYSQSAAEAVYSYNPDSRILILLRDRADFLRSWHHQLLFSFQESIEDFELAWRLSEDRPAETIPATCHDPKVLNYAAIGRFGEQITRYLDIFPPEQIRVIHFNDWLEDPRATYLEILDFLELDGDGRRDFPRINEAKVHGNKWLGRLIMHPPRAAVSMANAIKKLTGRKSLGLAMHAARQFSVPGYKTSMSAQLRTQITAYYEEDSRLTANLLNQISA